MPAGPGQGFGADTVPCVMGIVTYDVTNILGINGILYLTMVKHVWAQNLSLLNTS
mgnify:FL=1